MKRLLRLSLLKNIQHADVFVEFFIIILELVHRLIKLKPSLDLHGRATEGRACVLVSEVEMGLSRTAARVVLSPIVEHRHGQVVIIIGFRRTDA